MTPFSSKAYSQYGASLGRSSTVDRLFGRVHLRRVRLDSGGYDAGGAYWGIGTPLWCAWNDEGERYFRAADRDTAKATLPLCRFYR